VRARADDQQQLLPALASYACVLRPGRTAERYAGFGADLYEAESRIRLAAQLSQTGLDAEAAREVEAAAAFFQRAGAPGRAAEAAHVLRERA
jgi:hypothetical protein